MPDVHFHSSAGRLEGLLDPAEAPPPARGPRAAIVCHPHPIQGGTMDNKVVFTVARALRERGLDVLRFNFRSAGGSEGVHDGGKGEQDDVSAALALLAENGHDATGSVLMGGFSFGSWVGLSVALHDPRVGALLAIAPPVNFYDYTAIAATVLPLTVIYARDDELVPARAVETWLATCERPPRTHAVDGAGHLFHGRLRAIREAVDGFLDTLSAD